MFRWCRIPSFGPALPATILTFKEFGLSPMVVDAISAMGILVPTSAQQFGIPKLLMRQNLILNSQTGKGKTLTFLAPIVDHLIRENTDGIFPIPNKPRCIVIVPTRELAGQTLTVLRNFFGHLIGSACLAPGHLSFVKERRVLNQGVDILVSTPNRLKLHLDKKIMNMNEIRFCVVDEADALADEKYSTQVETILGPLAKKNACIAIVSATRTVAVTQFIERMKLEWASSGVAEHEVPASASQSFIPVGRRKRTDCLSDILHNARGKILVFVNSKSTCDFVGRRIKEIIPLHGSLPRKIRRENFSNFKKAKNAILVSTNLASRGLDLGKIDHVIMYDLPDNVADYLHRAGRTARAGAAGKVTSLVSARDAPLMKALAQKVTTAPKKEKRTTSKLVDGRPGRTRGRPERTISANRK